MAKKMLGDFTLNELRKMILAEVEKIDDEVTSVHAILTDDSGEFVFLDEDKKMQSVVAVMNQDGDFASYFLRWDVDRQQFDKCIDTVEMEDIMKQHDNTNIGS